jgi:hypothetical protein
VVAGPRTRLGIARQRHPDIRFLLVGAAPPAAFALARPLPTSAALAQLALRFVRASFAALALIRFSLLVALPVEARHLFLGPRRVQQRLQLIERAGSHRAALASIDDEPHGTIQRWDLRVRERSRDLLRQS